jgi:hypothetical protein
MKSQHKANKGADYPVEVLRRWKTQHEDEMRRTVGRPEEEKRHELAGTYKAVGVGKVTGADIRSPTKIAPGTRASAEGIGRCGSEEAKMNRANVSFGVQCSRCGSTFGELTYVSVGSSASNECPRCGGELVADNRWTNVSNYTCECGALIGHMVSGTAVCPICKKTI